LAAESGRDQRPGGPVVAVVVLVRVVGRVALGVIPEQPADLTGHALEDGIEHVSNCSVVPRALDAGKIHDEIWPILDRYTERVEDPSRRPPDARAARVFFFTGVSLRR
jgi:hypothetical protein